LEGERQMRILHTADLHLREYGDDRWETLLTLVEVGKQEKIELLVISGDLFDKGTNAESLRPRIREVFSNIGFRVVLIPGNHDRDAFSPGLYLGESVILLTDPNKPFECEAVRIWGLPFLSEHGEAIIYRLRSLADKLTPEKPNILLYHGELLDAVFGRRDFGDEGMNRYMPVRLSYFKDLRVDYVLAGHFHSRFSVWKLANGGYFVYPGSPISITKRETGQRKVNIFDLGDPPAEYPLDTPHFEQVTVELDPFEGRTPVEALQSCMRDLHPNSRAILTVKGFINGEAIGMSESELIQRIKRIAATCCVEERYEFRDIRTVLEDSLFKSFCAKLERANYDEKKKGDMRDMAIRAMMEARR